MHEFSLMKKIVDNALQTAKKENASKIKSVTIENGALSHLSRDNIEFWWQTLTKDTLAQDAIIIYIEKPARIHCNDCNQILEIKNNQTGSAKYDHDHDHNHDHIESEILSIICPNCSSNNTEVFEGLETNLIEIEMEIPALTTK